MAEDVPRPMSPVFAAGRRGVARWWRLRVLGAVAVPCLALAPVWAALAQAKGPQPHAQLVFSGETELATEVRGERAQIVRDRIDVAAAARPKRSL